MTITKLGRYDIVRVLGKGAMGLVYEARDPNLDRRVAIKTIKVENLSAEASADYEARFRTEARSAARLQHPNIVSVYDSERHGDTAYLVMEYVQGDDLKQHLDGGKRYSLEQSLGMVRDLLAALDYAHRQNIVHRDVKPANLLVEASGRVKLTDFGVARIQDSGEATRTKGSMVGTLKYMSPEQVQGLPVDSRADLFAAGIVLYQLLTGKRPFDGEGEFAIIHQIVSQNPAPPSSLNPQLPAALDAVVARALAKQREDRFASAHEFALALQEASGQAPDPTIVPPFSSTEFRSPGSTGSGALRSQGGTGSGVGGRTAEGSGATVTQELELVYWKDIKDTDDPADLRGFLDRFPQGIYADLARRRLRKFTGAESGDVSATRTTVAAVSPVSAVDDPTAAAPALDEATLVATRAADLAPADAGLPPAPAPVTETPPALPPEGPPTETSAPHLPSPPSRSPPSVPPRAEAAARKPGGAKRIVALVALVAVAGLAYLVLAGGDPAPAEVLAPADATSAPATGAETAVAPAAVAQSEALSSAAAAASQPVAKVAGPAVAAKALPVKEPAAAAGVTVPTGSPPAPPAAVTTPPAPQPSSVTAAVRPANAKPPADAKPALEASGPAQACEGRILFGYQSCLSEQCARPAFARHPVCVERSAAERAARSREGADTR